MTRLNINDMSTGRVVKNTIYYGVIPKISMLINILILPIVTPYLTTFDYGIHGLITSYTGLMVNIVPLGMNVHLTNSYYEFPKKYNLYWGRLLYIILLSSLLCGIVNSAILFCTLPGDSTDKLAIAVFGSFQVFFFAYGLVAQHLYTLKGTPLPLVLTNLIASTLGIVVSFVLIYFFKLGYWGLVAGTSIPSLVSFVIFCYQISLKGDIGVIIERNKRRFVKNLKIALPLIPHTLGFVLLTSSTRIVMDFYKVSIYDIGLFSHGCTMGNYIIIVTTALVTALVPQTQLTYRTHRLNDYRRLFYLCQGFGLISSLLFCIWMPEIYSILIKNESLLQSENIASLICFANVVMPFYTFASNVAFIEKETKKLLWLVFVPGTLNILLCVIFIPIFGYKSAIYSTMFAYWSQLAIPFVVKYYRDKVGEWLGGIYKLVILLAVIIILLIVGNYIKDLNIFLKIIATLSVSIIAFLVVKKFELTKGV